MLTSTVMVQFSYFIHLMKPGAMPLSMIITQPIIFGGVFGAAFGLYEIAVNPLIRHQPPEDKSQMQ